MRFVISIILVTVAGLLSTGCAASKPVRYYTIQPPFQSASPRVTNESRGLTLLMGEIAAPEGLQDERIRYRVGANQTCAYEYDRWADRPGTMVRDSLMRALRTSGNYQSVANAGSSATGDYLVRGKLSEFDEVDGASIRTRISLQLELIDRKTNRSVWDNLLEREEPVQSRDVASVVQSLDRNLQGVASQAAGEIDRFLTTLR